MNQPANFKIEVVQPNHSATPKLDLEVDPEDSIFSYIIASRVEKSTSCRPSITSTKIQEDIKNRSNIQRYSGIFLAVMSTLSYSLAALIQKVFHQYHPFTVSLWRFQGLIWPTIPIILFYKEYAKQPIFNGIWPPTEAKTFKNILFITLRSVFGCVSIVLQIYAFQYLHLADASVIIYSSPVFVLFVARIFLNEKAGYFAILIAVFTLVGVAIIARPPLLTGEAIDHKTILGIIFALACMLSATPVYVILRYLREVHYSVVTLCYGIEASLQCAILAVVFNVFKLPQNLVEWGLLAGLVIFTWGGQTMLILSLQLEQCGIVSLICSLDTCFAFILQFIFLGVVPDKYSLTGATIVITGVIATTFRKYLASLPEENKIRKKFGILLK